MIRTSLVDQLHTLGDSNGNVNYVLLGAFGNINFLISYIGYVIGYNIARRMAGDEECVLISNELLIAGGIILGFYLGVGM